jgi:putative oxidoreductase
MLHSLHLPNISDMPDLYAHQSASTSARWAHVLLRIFAGAVLWQHGAQKLFGLFGGSGAGISFTLSGVAGPLEFIGGLLIIIGLFTRPVAFVLSGEMAVVYFLLHVHRAFWPVENHGEVPVVLCFAFLYIAATGAGIFSIDYLRRRNRPSSIMS